MLHNTIWMFGVMERIVEKPAMDGPARDAAKTQIHKLHSSMEAFDDLWGNELSATAIACRAEMATVVANKEESLALYAEGVWDKLQTFDRGETTSGILFREMLRLLGREPDVVEIKNFLLEHRDLYATLVGFMGVFEKTRSDLIVVKNDYMARVSTFNEGFGEKCEGEFALFLAPAASSAVDVALAASPALDVPPGKAAAPPPASPARPEALAPGKAAVPSRSASRAASPARRKGRAKATSPSPDRYRDASPDEGEGGSKDDLLPKKRSTEIFISDATPVESSKEESEDEKSAVEESEGDSEDEDPGPKERKAISAKKAAEKERINTLKKLERSEALVRKNQAKNEDARRAMEEGTPLPAPVPAGRGKGKKKEEVPAPAGGVRKKKPVDVEGKRRRAALSDPGNQVSWDTNDDADHDQEAALRHARKKPK